MDRQRLTFLAINVSNLKASVEFYRLILGDPLHDSSHDSELEDPWYGGEHAACTWTDGAFMHFAIYPIREPNRPMTTAAQIGFHVVDIDMVYRRIEGQGFRIVEPLREEPWGRTVRYLDPDGNIVSITQGAT